MSKAENDANKTNDEIREPEEELHEEHPAQSEDDSYLMFPESAKDSKNSSAKPPSSAPKTVAFEDEFVMPKESYKDSVKNSRKREKAARARAKEAQLREQDGDTDYIAARRHRHHHHHHHHHHHGTSMHSGRTKNNNTPEAEREAMDGYVFKTPHKSKKRRRRKHRTLAVRIVTIALIVILGLAILTGGTYFILRQIGDAQLHNYEDVSIEVSDDRGISSQDLQILNEGKEITYNGEIYVLNEDVISFVLIGVDQSMEDDEAMMSDAIYIVAIDTRTNRISMIPVSRDTIADVDVYSEQGSFIDTEKRQLSYAYSFYGAGKNGAENTTAALSKLFYGMPFRNYFAIDLDAFVTLNDSVGGVTLTPTMTFTSPIDGSVIQEGESTTLFGKEAERYIRSRDLSELDSNNDRMNRQIQYIQAFLDAAVPAARADISIVPDLYNTIKNNSETSITVPQMTYLASTALSMISDPSQIEYKNIKGEMKEGEHAEFYPDDQSVLETMLDVFYQKK